jgi:hypothetical protein
MVQGISDEGIAAAIRRQEEAEKAAEDAKRAELAAEQKAAE